MKLLLAAVMAVILIVLLLLPPLKKYKGLILAAYGFGFMLLVAIQTYRTVGGILPFYHAKEQMFYQKEFADESLYPDALIQMLVKDKTVYTKDDLDEYIEENFVENSNDMKDGKYWIYPKYHQINMTNYLDAVGANVVALDEYNDVFIDEKNQDDFEFAGYGNDMFRFMFLLSKEKEEWSNFFFFYWFYSFRLKEMNVYINPDGINETDEIVLIWDDKENETIHIMTKEYYDEEVAANG